MKYLSILIVFSLLLLFTTCKKENEFRSGIKSFTLLDSPENGGLNKEDLSTWGGSVIQGDDGKYHMFVSGFTNDCGLDSWQYNSKILRATSDHPLGPFEIQETIVDAMAHNPTIRTTPDGEYVLFYIGEPKSNNDLLTDCSNGITNSGPSGALTPWTCLLNVMSAPSPSGPWSESKQVVDLLWIPICATNPAPIINENGSVNYYYRAYDILDGATERLYKGFADKWDGTYSSSGTSPIIDIEAEDSFVWKDETGYYMVFNNKFEDDFNTGGLAYSEDGEKFENLETLYSREIKFSNGSTKTVLRRERPQILWLEENRGVLYTAVQENGGNDKIFTLATPIGNWTEEQLEIN